MKTFKYELIKTDEANNVHYVIQKKSTLKCKKVLGIKIPIKTVKQEVQTLAVKFVDHKNAWYKVSKGSNGYYIALKEIKNKKLINYLNKKL